jgi:hypothetical protein
VFLHRIGRHAPAAWGVWRLEPQLRGAPHYHLILWGWRIEREWVSRAWWEVVGSGEETHLKAGTNVQQARSHDGAIAYCSKYLGKRPPGCQWERPGRWWGLHRRRLATMTPRQWECSDSAWLLVHRVVRKLARKNGHRCPTGRVTLDNGEVSRVGCRTYLPGAALLRLLRWARNETMTTMQVLTEATPADARTKGRADFEVVQIADDGEVVARYLARLVRGVDGWSIRDWRQVSEGFLGEQTVRQLSFAPKLPDLFGRLESAMEANIKPVDGAKLADLP